MYQHVVPPQEEGQLVLLEGKETIGPTFPPLTDPCLPEPLSLLSPASDNSIPEIYF